MQIEINITDKLTSKTKDIPKVVVVGIGAGRMQEAILALAHAMSTTCISVKQLQEARELMLKYSYPMPDSLLLKRIEIPEFNYTPTLEYNSTPKNYGLRKTKKYRL